MFSITIVAPPPPTVSKVHPSSGPAAGGNRVVITGTALRTVSAVMFGSYPLSSFTVNRTGTKIVAYPPSESGGIVHVRVTAFGGTSTISRRPIWVCSATAMGSTGTGALPVVTRVSSGVVPLSVSVRATVT